MFKYIIVYTFHTELCKLLVEGLLAVGLTYPISGLLFADCRCMVA